MYKNLCLLISLLVIFFHSSAQKDTLFWFAAPEITQSTNFYDRPIHLKLTSYSQPAVVVIDQPANSSFNPITVSLAANTSQFVDLTNFINSIENKPANQVNNFGIRISSTNLISAYYENVSSYCNCNPELFVLKGKYALGTEFTAITTNIYDNNINYSPTPHCKLDIVATDSNTTVTIIPSNNVLGHLANIPYTITLGKGQTYSIEASSVLGSNHLFNTKINSNKLIAVTYTNDLISPCGDMMGDQLIPDVFLGNDYLIAKGFLTGSAANTQDRVFIMALNAGTTVNINGTFFNTLAAGSIVSTGITGSSINIAASNKISVLHVSGFGCEKACAVIPPTLCSGSSSASFMRSANDLGITLVTHVSNIGNFSINGNTTTITSAAFSAIPATSNQYYAASINNLSSSLFPTNTFIKVENSSGVFQMGAIMGSNTIGSKFGYFTDFGSDSLLVGITPAYCIGDTLQLSILNSLSSSTYTWTGPNFNATGSSIQIPLTSPSQLGYYSVVGNNNGCPSQPEIIVIDSLNSLPIPILSADTIICLGDSINILPSNIDSNFVLTWIKPNGQLISSTLQNFSIPNSTLSDSGTYGIYVSDTTTSFCSSDTTFITIHINSPSSITSSTTNSPLCAGDTLVVYLSNSNPNATYSLSDTSLLFAINNNQLQVYNIDSSSTFSIISETYQCPSDTANISVVINSNLQLDSVSSIPNMCSGQDLFVNFYPNYQSGIWQITYPNNQIDTLPNPQLSILSAVTSNSGIYQIQNIEFPNCPTFPLAFTATIDTFPAINVINFNNPLCKGDTLVIQIQNNSTTPNYFLSDTSLQFSLSANLLQVSNLESSSSFFIISDGGQCPNDSAAISVTVNSNAELDSVVTNSPLCDGQDFHANFYPNNLNGIWKLTFPNNQVDTLSSGTYSVISANISNNGNYQIEHIEFPNCPSYPLAFDINVFSFPTINILNSNSPICANESLVVQFNANNCDSIQIGGSIAPFNISSTLNSYSFNNLQPTNNGLLSISTLSPYCPNNSDSLSFTVIANPTLNTIVSNSPICEGNDLILTLSPSNSYTNYWIYPNGSITQADSVLISNVSLNNSGIYAAFALNDNCSSDTIQTLVNINEKLTLNPDEGFIVCETGSININANPNHANSTIEWTLPDGSTYFGDSITILNASSNNAGTYLINGSYLDCPVVNDSVTISIVSNQLQLLNEYQICIGSVQLPLNENFTYRINNENFNPPFAISETGTYVITQTNELGCSAEQTVTITTLNCEPFVYYPNTIHLNSIYGNNLWRLMHQNISGIELMIFNRWGELIYEIKGDDIFWDATYNNQPVPIGIYVAHLGYADMANNYHRVVFNLHVF